MYAATDNILADVRCGDHLMGEKFETNELPTIRVKLVGTAPFIKVQVIEDSRTVYSTIPNAADVDFTWLDLAAVKGQQHYYYVRGEQANGQLVWVSPMWITFR